MNEVVDEAAASRALVPERLSDQLASTLERLDELSEEELLMVIGADSLVPIEQRFAAVNAYASAAETAALKEKGVIDDETVDLALRGRRKVQLILAEWGDRLQGVCPLWEKGASLEDLALFIAGMLATVVVTWWLGALLAVALYIAKHQIDKFCKGELPAPLEMPAT